MKIEQSNLYSEHSTYCHYCNGLYNAGFIMAVFQFIFTTFRSQCRVIHFRNYWPLNKIQNPADDVIILHYSLPPPPPSTVS